MVGLVAACGGEVAPTTFGGAEPGEGIPLGLARIEVEPDHTECMGFIPEMCVGVREIEHGYEWSVYDWEIGGLTLEEGTSYVLDVRIEELEDPPQDVGSISYELEAVIEETIEAEPAAG